MSEFSQDELNAFFKRKLGNNADTDGMWNTPPDFVFDNAMQKVNGVTSQKRPSRKWLLLLLIPIGFMFCFLILNQRHLNNLNNKLSAMSETVDNQRYQINQLESKLKAKSTNPKINDKSVDKYDLIAEPEKHVTNTSPLNLPQSHKPRLLSGSSIQKHSDSQSNFIFRNENKPIVKSNLSKVDHILKEDIEVSFLVSKGRSMMLDIPMRLLKEPMGSFNNISTSESVSFDETIRYGIFVSQNYAALSMDNAVETCELNYYDSRYSGMGLHFAAEKSISKKVDMQFGLSYQLINNRSEMRQDNFYNPDNEVEMSNGDMNYYMDLTVETPFGEVSSPTSFTVDPSSVNNDDIINQTTQTEQQLNVISLRVGPKYNFLRAGDFSFFINSAIGYNRILHYSNDLKTALKMNDKEMLNFNSSPIKIKDINKNFMSVQAGLGMAFKISEKTQFVLSTHYNTSINSLRVASSNTSPTVYLKQWNTLMGLNVNF